MASEFKNTEEYINRYGTEVVAEIRTRLRGHGKIASSELYDSIDYEVKENTRRFILTFKMSRHGQFVDKGTKPSKYANKEGGGSGKSAFITALQKWCEIKGLPKNAAFPIRRNIWKFGLPPTNFFTIPTTRRRKQFEKNVEKNMAKDIENIIKKDVNKFSKRAR
jgi:hypothetical protein